MKSQFVKDLREKDSVAAPFLIKFAAVQVGKTGKSYMNVVLTDKTGELEARIWDDITKYSGQLVKDSYVHIDGHVQVFQNRRQIVIKSARVLREDEIDPKDYVRDQGLDAEKLYSALMGFVDSMADPHYKALAYAVLRDDVDIVARIKKAPAAKSVHHAYPVGLLEHVVSIAGLLDGIARHYQPYLDRDLLFLGGFFHDIAKLWEMTYDRTTEYTMEGQLIGHLVMGVELIEKKVQILNQEHLKALAEGRTPLIPSLFPDEKKLLVKHLIVAHHGKLEYGSPKEPQTLEALVVHYIDDLDSKVNAIRMFIEADQTQGRWTGLNRQYSRFFLKPQWALDLQQGS